MPRIISDQLGQDILGLWDFAWSFVACISLANLGIGSSLNRFIANYRADNELDKLRVATSTVVVIQAIIALLVVLVVLVCTSYLPSLYPGLGEQVATAQSVIFFLGMSIAAQFLFDTSRGVLTGCHRWDIYNALNAGTNIVCSLLMIGAFILGKGLVAASAIYFVCTFIEGLSRAFVARRVCPESTWRGSAVSLSFAAEILRFGSSLFVLGLIPIIVNQTTNILIAVTLGPASLAVFARPNALLRVLRTFVTKFTFVLTPMAGPILSKEGPAELRKFLFSCTEYAFAFTLPPTTIFCLYGDEVVGLWMGQEYRNSPLVLILGLGLILRLSLNPIHRILIGLNLHRRIAFIGLGVSLVFYGLGTIIIRLLGPSIEAYAILMSVTLTLVNGILIPSYACQKLEIPFVMFLRQSAKRIIPIWSVATFVLLFLDTIVEGTAAMILNVILYGILLSLMYWSILLPEKVRRDLIEKILGRDVK